MTKYDLNYEYANVWYLGTERWRQTWTPTRSVGHVEVYFLASLLPSTMYATCLCWLHCWSRAISVELSRWSEADKNMKWRSSTTTKCRKPISDDVDNVWLWQPRCGLHQHVSDVLNPDKSEDLSSTQLNPDDREDLSAALVPQRYYRRNVDVIYV